MRFVVAASSAALLAGCAGVANGPVDFRFPSQQEYDNAVKYVTPQAVQQRAGNSYSTTPSFVPHAFFTGRQGAPTQTVTGQFATPCQYNYNGQLFVRLFVGGCPSQVPVQ